jgi:hypothetical protein
MEFNDKVEAPCVVTFGVDPNEDVSSFKSRAIDPVENFELVRTTTRLIVESSERIRRTGCEVTDPVTHLNSYVAVVILVVVVCPELNRYVVEQSSRAISDFLLFAILSTSWMC